MNKFGLTTGQIEAIQNILERALIDEQVLIVWIFGSRARGDHRSYSDVDLLLEATPPFSDVQLSKLKGDLEESNLPFKFDLVTPQSLYAPYSKKILEEKQRFFI